MAPFLLSKVFSSSSSLFHPLIHLLEAKVEPAPVFLPDYWDFGGHNHNESSSSLSSFESTSSESDTEEEEHRPAVTHKNRTIAETTIVKMIDFAHAVPNPPENKVIDENYLHGLKQMIAMFESMLRDKGEIQRQLDLSFAPPIPPPAPENPIAPKPTEDLMSKMNPFNWFSKSASLATVPSATPQEHQDVVRRGHANTISSVPSLHSVPLVPISDKMPKSLDSFLASKSQPDLGADKGKTNIRAHSNDIRRSGSENNLVGNAQISSSESDGSYSWLLPCTLTDPETTDSFPRVPSEGELDSRSPGTSSEKDGDSTDSPLSSGQSGKEGPIAHRRSTDKVKRKKVPSKAPRQDLPAIHLDDSALDTGGRKERRSRRKLTAHSSTLAPKPKKIKKGGSVRMKRVTSAILDGEAAISGQDQASGDRGREISKPVKSPGADRTSTRSLSPSPPTSGGSERRSSKASKKAKKKAKKRAESSALPIGGKHKKKTHRQTKSEGSGSNEGGEEKPPGTTEQAGAQPSHAGHRPHHTVGALHPDTPQNNVKKKIKKRKKEDVKTSEGGKKHYKATKVKSHRTSKTEKRDKGKTTPNGETSSEAAMNNINIDLRGTKFVPYGEGEVKSHRIAELEEELQRLRAETEALKQENKELKEWRQRHQLVCPESRSTATESRGGEKGAKEKVVE